MREYLSPGVYTQESDRSFLESSAPSSPAAIFIGGFTKGQAFIPMKIKDSRDLLDRTGQPNGKYFSQYAALEYSKHKGNFWVQRLLWEDGYSSSAYAIIGKGDDDLNTQWSILSILGSISHSAGNALELGTAGTCSTTPNSEMFSSSTSLVPFTFTISGIPYSFDSLSDVKNIENYFGRNPHQKGKPAYLFNIYQNDVTKSNYTTVSIIKMPDNFINYENVGFNHSKTPMIQDEFGVNLFEIHHISDGSYTNKDIKIAIQSVRTSLDTYTMFDVIVRAYNDDDKKPAILETFYDVDLNPMSDNYIAKRVGDMYYQYDVDSAKMRLMGDFNNKSKYIRVQVSDDVKSNNITKTGVPYTTLRYPTPLGTGSGNALIHWNYPNVCTSSEELGVWPDKKYFNHQGYDVSDPEVMGLSEATGVDGSINNWTDSKTTSKVVFTGDYILPLFGGFDGKNPTVGDVTEDTTLMGFDLSSVDSPGYKSYIKALNIIKSVQSYDIDIISMAGISLENGHKNVFEYALEQVCEFRGDCIVVADATKLDEMKYDKAVEKTQAFDSSYGAVYYPPVKIKDMYTKTHPTIPAATFIPAVIAYTQIISQPHYAPAGINRGTLEVLQAINKLNRVQRDLLYKNNVNPIASFAARGTVVWGQKTLQKQASALDRLNVRILINRIKKWIDDYGKQVLFDNNTTSLRSVFTIGVQQYLGKLVQNNGLYAFKFIMDQSNNTPDVLDRNQLVGQMWLKPAKTTQFIVIPINIVRTDTEL